MGVKMRTLFRSNFFVQFVVIFIAIPLILWIQTSLPERTLLKETLSVLTILAFFQMIGQFFISRSNSAAVAELKMSSLVNIHNVIGYTAVTILLIHPFLLVVPRFFEAGVAPGEALITIITTWTSPGVVLGIIAWCLMLTLGMLALTRKKLPLKYPTWRLIHGILSILFISTATWHVIDLGRHANLAMLIFVAMLTASGVLLLLTTYWSKTQKSKVI